MKSVIFFILAIMVIVSPYQKGLYFNQDFYLPAIIICLLFVLLTIWLLIKKRLDSIKSTLFIFLLPASFLFSFFTARNPQGAWDSLIQWGSYACFFVLLSWVSIERKIKRLFPVVFQLTGIWISIHMLLVYYGVFVFRNAIVAGRFAGVFQYPNTFGMIMGTFLLFSLFMLLQSNRAFLFYAVPLVVYSVCLIQSFSRGMFLIFPVVWFIGLFYLNFKKQLEYIIYTLLSLGGGLLTYYFMEKERESHLPGIGPLLLSICLCILAAIFIKRFVSSKESYVFIEKIQSKKGQKWFIPVFFLLFMFFGILDIHDQGLIYQHLPNKLQDRMITASFNAPTAVERITFYKDALKASKDSPLIGFGGEAWASINKKYQSLPYQSNKIHNGYLELILDTGWLGFAIFIGVIFYLFILVNRSKKQEIKPAVLIPIIAVFLHSFLDFNFSYSSIWFFIWWLFVMGRSGDSEKEEQMNLKLSHLPVLSMALMAIVICFFSVRFLLSNQSYNVYRTATSLAIKEVALENTLLYAPKNTTYQTKLSEIYFLNFKSFKEQQDKEKAIHSIKHMVSIEPENSIVYQKAGAIADYMDEKDLSLTFYTRGLKIDHYNKQLYEGNIKLKVEKAIEFHRQAKINEAKIWSKSALKDYQQSMKWQSYFSSHAPKDADRFNSRNFTTTDKSKLYAALAYYLLKDYKTVIKITNQIDSNSLEKEKASALAYLSFDKIGRICKNCNNLHSSKFNELVSDYRKKLD